MKRTVLLALYLAAMVAVVVCVDVLFLRNRLWERVVVNLGIVVVFGGGYFAFLRKR